MKTLFRTSLILSILFTIFFGFTGYQGFRVESVSAMEHDQEMSMPDCEMEEGDFVTPVMNRQSLSCIEYCLSAAATMNLVSTSLAPTISFFAVILTDVESVQLETVHETYFETLFPRREPSQQLIIQKRE